MMLTVASSPPTYHDICCGSSHLFPPSTTPPRREAHWNPKGAPPRVLIKKCILGAQHVNCCGDCGALPWSPLDIKNLFQQLLRAAER